MKVGRSRSGSSLGFLSSGTTATAEFHSSNNVTVVGAGEAPLALKHQLQAGIEFYLSHQRPLIFASHVALLKHQSTVSSE